MLNTTEIVHWNCLIQEFTGSFLPWEIWIRMPSSAYTKCSTCAMNYSLVDNIQQKRKITLQIISILRLSLSVYILAGNCIWWMWIDNEVQMIIATTELRKQSNISATNRTAIKAEFPFAIVRSLFACHIFRPHGKYKLCSFGFCLISVCARDECWTRRSLHAVATLTQL